MGSLAPFTLKGFYLLTWGNALGSNVWNTIVSRRLTAPQAMEEAQQGPQQVPARGTLNGGAGGMRRRPREGPAEAMRGNDTERGEGRGHPATRPR